MAFNTAGATNTLSPIILPNIGIIDERAATPIIPGVELSNSLIVEFPFLEERIFRSANSFPDEELLIDRIPSVSHLHIVL